VLLNLEKWMEKKENGIKNYELFRTSRGSSPIYRIEPETAPFDVAPLFGYIFAKNRLWAGQYSFMVVAIDSAGQV
jgi:hypothetical protein